MKTNFIKKDEKIIAVIMDYKEYQRLKEIEEDKEDYYSVLKTKLETKEWIDHADLRKELEL